MSDCVIELRAELARSKVQRLERQAEMEEVTRPKALSLSGTSGTSPRISRLGQLESMPDRN